MRDKFLQFSQIFAKFTKINPREKSTGSRLAKLNPCELFVVVVVFQN